MRLRRCLGQAAGGLVLRGAHDPVGLRAGGGEQRLPQRPQGHVGGMGVEVPAHPDASAADGVGPEPPVSGITTVSGRPGLGGSSSSAPSAIAAAGVRTTTATSSLEGLPGRQDRAGVVGGGHAGAREGEAGDPAALAQHDEAAHPQAFPMRITATTRP